MAGFGIYGLVQLALGQGTDPARVITESVLILLFAGGMGLLARLWLGSSSWPGTPTVVWHALLIPVLIEMVKAGQWLVSLALALVIGLAIWAVIADPERPATSTATSTGPSSRMMPKPRMFTMNTSAPKSCSCSAER